MTTEKNVALTIWTFVSKVMSLLFNMLSRFAMGGFPDSLVGKESACNAGDPGLIPRLGRSAGEGKGYPFQYSWASLVAQLVKNLPAMQERDPGPVPGLGRSPGEGKGYPLQYSVLQNSRTVLSMGLCQLGTT